MRLVEGHAAPEFSIKDTKGSSISLDLYKDNYLLLSFFRYAGCPFCNITLIKLIERYDNFASRGLQTVAFFQSDDDSINKYVASRNPPFPLIADPEKTVYNAYGVESSRAGAVKSILKIPVTTAAIIRGDVVQGTMDGDKLLMPAQFIIGPDGIIETAHYGTDFGDKIPMFEIEKLILTKITKYN